MAPSANRQASSSTKAHRGRAGFGRALSMMAFLPLAGRFPMYARLVTALALDERMPASRKALLAGAAGYLVLGRDLGIDRVAFDRDIAQIRRLTPGPVRRTIRRVPALVGSAADTIQHIGLWPRLRTWINREDPIA